MTDAPYLPRLIETSFAEALRVMPVTVVTGARQTGKSTLVRAGAAASARTLLSLDDLGVRDRARQAPDQLVTQDRQVTSMRSSGSPTC